MIAKITGHVRKKAQGNVGTELPRGDSRIDLPSDRRSNSQVVGLVPDCGTHDVETSRCNDRCHVVGLCQRRSGPVEPYMEMDLGMNGAPPLLAHGSDNDWSTKCDLIINPLGLETGGECDSVPARTSWTNAFGRGNGSGAGMTIGYDWGVVKLELEYRYRSTTYDDRSDTTFR